MKKAFSLIELIVVIIILGTLTAIVLPNLIETGDKQKNKIVCIQMGNIAQTLDMYKLDNSSYPQTEEGLNLLLEKKYFNKGKLPKDSWNNEFVYILNDNSFDLISFGLDQKEGTSDDIYLSKCNK